MGGSQSHPKLPIDVPGAPPYKYSPIEGRTIRLLKVTPVEKKGRAPEGPDPQLPKDVEPDSTLGDDRQQQSSDSHVKNISGLKDTAERMRPQYEVELVDALVEWAPEYEPISYTWGDPNRCHTLQLKDGSALAITVTLKDCIPYLIKASKTGHLWIDQLCINQEDNEEKGRQVAMMGTIYKRGETTLVWLGEHDSASGTIIHELGVRGLKSTNRHEEFLWSISSDSTLRHLAYWEKIFPPSCELHPTDKPFVLKRPVDYSPRGPWWPNKPPPEAERLLLCGPCFRRHILDVRSAAFDFFKRQWFSRAWVVQEAVLSPWNLFLIGNSALTIRDLEEVPTILNDMGLGDDFYSMTDPSWRGGTCPGYRSLHEITSMRQHAPGRDGSDYMQVWSLLDYLRLTGIQATNPRDYIYSLLGIHWKAGALFTPAYDLPVRDIFIDAARRMIVDSGHLGILASVGSSDPKLELPSWVPDWTSRPSVTVLQMPTFSAMNWPNTGAEKVSDLSSPRLEVKGKRLGRIRWVHPADIDAILDSLDLHRKRFDEQDVRNMLVLLSDLAADINARRRGQGQKRLTAASLLWQLDVGPSNKPKVLHNGKEDICWRHGGDDPAVDLRSFAHLVRGRRICIGDRDIIGLVPKSCVAGDQVWILCGSNQQHVLRVVDDGEFALMGNCIWDRQRQPQMSFRSGKMHTDSGWTRYEEGDIKSIVLV